MIPTYDRNPGLTVDQKLTSLIESLVLCLNEKADQDESKRAKELLGELSSALIPKQLETEYIANSYVSEASFNRIAAFKIGHVLIINGLLNLTSDMPSSAGASGVGSVTIGRIVDMPAITGGTTYGQQVPVGLGGSLNIAVDNSGYISIYNYGSTISHSWARFNYAIAVN